MQSRYHFYLNKNNKLLFELPFANGIVASKPFSSGLKAFLAETQPEMSRINFQGIYHQVKPLDVITTT